jgi:16S rRNA (guanine966-N2)-methyltransferase
MRIISGRYKGRILKNFKAEHIRPTTDRVKETIFNILMHDIPGARVLDLFSGTGNLGIEALSRGAIYVEFVDANSLSVKIARENIADLKITEPHKIIMKDAFKYLKSADAEPFQVILVDPPFTEALAHDCMTALSESKIVANGTLVVIESAKRERIEDQYGSFQLLDRRQFGDKSASFFRFSLPT